MDRFNNQTTQWRNKGGITKINVYYNSNDRCLVGLKVTYGEPPMDTSRNAGLAI